MSKPAEAPPPVYRDDASLQDAISLHTTPEDADAPEAMAGNILANPPAYSDEDGNEEGPWVHNQYADAQPSGVIMNSSKGIDIVINNLMDTDPHFLENTIRRASQVPPAKLIHIVGTHKQTTKVNGKNDVTIITDFDLKLRLTEYLFTHPGRSAWKELRTVENTDKTYRGTIFKKSVKSDEASIESGKPSLREWCHRYCANHSKLKTFRFTRVVTNLDETFLRDRITALVRNTNYRGSLSISFSTENLGFELHSDHLVHRWRYNIVVMVIFFVTLLAVLVIPILWLCTKRYDVVRAEWPFARMQEDGRKVYATLSEQQWMDRWHKVIEKSVVEKKQGMLTEEDLTRADEPTQQFNSGNRGLDSAVNLLGAGVRVFGEANRQLGWGRDC